MDKKRTGEQSRASIESFGRLSSDARAGWTRITSSPIVNLLTSLGGDEVHWEILAAAKRRHVWFDLTTFTARSSARIRRTFGVAVFKSKRSDSHAVNQIAWSLNTFHSRLFRVIAN